MCSIIKFCCSDLKQKNSERKQRWISIECNNVVIKNPYKINFLCTFADLVFSRVSWCEQLSMLTDKDKAAAWSLIIQTSCCHRNISPPNKSRPKNKAAPPWQKTFVKSQWVCELKFTRVITMSAVIWIISSYPFDPLFTGEIIVEQSPLKGIKTQNKKLYWKKEIEICLII